MRIIYNNIIEDSTITPTTENANYPADNLKDSRSTRLYRSTADGAQRVTFHNADSSASYIIIKNHNITSGATIKLQANDSNIWGAPSLDETITHDSDTMILNFTEAEYNYWSLYVDDGSNPDNYIEIGLIYLGVYVQMPGMEPKQQIPYATQSKSKLSQSRQLYGDSRVNYRSAKISFPHLTNAQRQAINAMYDIVKNTKPIFLLVWEGDLDFEPAMYAFIADARLAWARNDNSNFPWSVSMQFEEVF